MQNIYGLTPLNRESFTPLGVGPTPTLGADVTLYPLLPSSTTPVTYNGLTFKPALTTTATSVFNPIPVGTTPAAPCLRRRRSDHAPNQLLLLDRQRPGGPRVQRPPAGELLQRARGLRCRLSPRPGATTTINPNPTGPVYKDSTTTPNTGYSIPPNVPAVIQTFNTTTGFDPMTNGILVNPTFTIHLVCSARGSHDRDRDHSRRPDQFQVEDSYRHRGWWFKASSSLSGFACVGPANHFAVSATKPMLVVDAMRVPYIDGSGATVGTSPAGNPALSGAFNTGSTRPSGFSPTGADMPCRYSRDRLPHQRSLRSPMTLATVIPSSSCPPRPLIRMSWGRRDFIGPIPPPATPRLCRFITRWAGPTSMRWVRAARRTTRPRPGTTSPSMTATLLAWPSSCSCRRVRPASSPSSSLNSLLLK